MNAAIPIASTQPYSATRFEAFRIVEASKQSPADEWSKRPPQRTTYALGDIPATSLGEALNATLGKCLILHKEHLAIRETNDRGSRVHLFSIRRKSAPSYRFVDHQQVREHRLYAAHLCTFDGGVFQ
jgi:hypothetical protein